MAVSAVHYLPVSPFTNTSSSKPNLASSYNKSATFSLTTYEVEGFKCYWLNKQIEPLWMHPSFIPDSS